MRVVGACYDLNIDLQLIKITPTIEQSAPTPTDVGEKSFYRTHQKKSFWRKPANNQFRGPQEMLHQ